MRHILFSFLLLGGFFLMGFSGCQQKTTLDRQPDQNAMMAEKRYGVESGVISYDLVGLQKGSETLYFRDWGKREARYREMKIGGIAGANMPGSSIKQLTITDGDTVYTIDLNTRTGMKVKNTGEVLGMEKQEALAMGMEMAKNLGAKQSGTKEIAGKTCTVWNIENLGSNTCLWENIALEATTSINAIGSGIIATKVETGIDIPDDTFAVPDDVTLHNQEDLSQVLQKAKSGTMLQE